MSSGGGNNSITEYEKQKLANVERNKRRLEALNIPRLDTVAKQVRQKKISKKTPATSKATAEPHNLRPRPQRTAQEEQVLADIQELGDFLADNEDIDSGNQINNPQKKRKGRGITRKEDIFSMTPNMPKLAVILNDRGQPVGKNGRKLSSVVGCQVRKKLSVGCLDWRLVDDEKKYELWTDIKGLQLGRPPRRDENYIKTHTRKNGVPSRQAEPIINKLKEVVEAHPELKDKTIQEGDAFAAVCGEKEPKGYVRVWGLGPTPQDVGTPGLKCYMPTRLQMEIFARKKAECEKAALKNQLDKLQARMNLMEQRGQQDRSSAEPMSQNCSTSRLHVNTRLDQIFDEPEQEEGEEDYHSGDDECDSEDHEDIPSQVDEADPPRSNDIARSDHDALVGKDVILFAMIRDQPVAKGTIISTKPTTLVDDQAIGTQYCEVIVTHVLKRDAILPRPYTRTDTMGDALMMSIAWPYKRLKVCNKASTPPASGSIRRG